MSLAEGVVAAARCHALGLGPMSGRGQLRPSRPRKPASALPLKADPRRTLLVVRFVPTGDIAVLYVAESSSGLTAMGVALVLRHYAKRSVRPSDYAVVGLDQALREADRFAGFDSRHFPR